RGLTKRGHHVELWRPPVRQEEFLRLADLATEHEHPIPEYEKDSRFYIGRLWLYYKWSERIVAAMHEHSRRCAEEIDQGGFDLLFSNVDMVFHAPFISRHVHLPKTIYLHEPRRRLHEAMPELPWILPDDPGLRGWGLNSIKKRGRASIAVYHDRVALTEELKNIRPFDQILVNSRFSRESVLRAYGLDSEVCYLGIDTDLFENRSLERERFVISLGSLIPTKNPEFVIESIARIPEGTRPTLVWVGNTKDEAYLSRMKRLAAELGVTFVPRLYITDEELVDLLNRAWAMVYAPRLEPFGFAPLEACSCGCPVIAVAEGGVRETVVDGENGLLCEHDPQEFADAVLRLLEDKPLRDRLGAQASQVVRSRWTLEAADDRLEAKLAKIL
ncbi:MAG TPA: glycosyltransferase family 4 protein, partial [Fimbriimonas sp.]